ncbi:hypothetical protein OIU85_005085 [Salix viminalis]|uniref:Uncharacterized protein n=1 Tax=Salix viminalis TaxID=40686 RepID=A0A9Q0SYU8_SALVM|nr:hypothetical protein OIU85_005085 [Salix viminalis]
MYFQMRNVVQPGCEIQCRDSRTEVVPEFRGYQIIHCIKKTLNDVICIGIAGAWNVFKFQLLSVTFSHTMYDFSHFVGKQLQVGLSFLSLFY